MTGLRYLSGGESHGKCLIAIIEGLPANLTLDITAINGELARRQAGYGRGPRMKLEKDQVQILTGLRNGITLGSPLTLLIANKDWPNWQQVMNPVGENKGEPITNPRPGHADLPGALKYRQSDMRNIFERASARETAIRVAVGAVAKQLLRVFGVQIVSHVVAIGSVTAREKHIPVEDIEAIAAASPVRCLDPEATQAMVAKITATQEEGDSLGGIFEVQVHNLPWGLGSHVHWDRKLDGRLAQAVVSIQGVKGVEFGAGFASASMSGSKFHDQIIYDGKFSLGSNNAGGVLGGISTSAPIVIRAAMKPIPTLVKPLLSVDFITKEPCNACVQRTDACAVPAASIVAEAAIAWELAVAFLEKFGGDSKQEIINNYKSFCESLA
ncbi:MAG: chorismate synthase [bacterium]|jgi:chorismate synthase